MFLTVWKALGQRKAPCRPVKLLEGQQSSPRAAKTPQGPAELLGGQQSSPRTTKTPWGPVKLLGGQQKSPGTTKTPQGPAELPRRVRGCPGALRVPPGLGTSTRRGGLVSPGWLLGVGRGGPGLGGRGIQGAGSPLLRHSQASLAKLAGFYKWRGGATAAALDARSPARRQPLKTARRCRPPPATAHRAGRCRRPPLHLNADSAQFCPSRIRRSPYQLSPLAMRSPKPPPPPARGAIAVAPANAVAACPRALPAAGPCPALPARPQPHARPLVL